MIRRPQAMRFVIAALLITLLGCKNNGAGSDPTAVVARNKADLKKELTAAAASGYRGNTPGRLKGAIVYIDALGSVLGVQQIAVQSRNGKRFIDVRCADGLVHLEVAGDMAVNEQPAFLIGDVTED